jgi:hypothetical protein
VPDQAVAASGEHLANRRPRLVGSPSVSAADGRDEGQRFIVLAQETGEAVAEGWGAVPGTSRRDRLLEDLEVLRALCRTEGGRQLKPLCLQLVDSVAMASAVDLARPCR